MPAFQADTVLPLAGYTAPEAPAEWTQEQQDAVAFAEAAIAAYTGAPWVADTDPPVYVADTLRIRLDSPRYRFPIPRDVQTIVSVVPAQSADHSIVPTPEFGYMELWDDDAEGEALNPRWEAGPYIVAVTRGRTPDETSNRAAALLAAYYLRLPDPERSQYSSFAEGDFSGSYRLRRLPVPECHVLLQPYRADFGRVA